VEDTIAVETDLFEHRELKPHFINPCCFGEDFAGWLKQQLSPLTEEGFRFSDAIQEDYGWGFWAQCGADRFWVAISYAGDGPQEPPAEWVISLRQNAGLNALTWIFRKAPAEAFTRLRAAVWQTLRSNRAIKELERP